jgi:hypothetical protein
MLNKAETFTKKVDKLKEARLQFLQLHKLLVDIERDRYQNKNGIVSSGTFLNLLIGDEQFSWLRKFSALIVDIDEMFDLDDGYHEGFVDKHLEAIKEIVSLGSLDEEFNAKFQELLNTNPKVSEKNNHLLNFLKN